MNVLQCVGTGTVANTKNTNTKEIFVYLPLNNPTAEGGVQLDVKQVQNTAQDSEGKPVTTNVLKSNKMVPATWIALGEPNRLTPPDVREGTQVALYNVTGSSDYYWTTFGFAAETMRLESVIFGWNGDPNINKDSTFDISKYYQFTIDTRSGVVSFRNSNANGEATILDLTFNYMAGHLSLSGAQKNQLVFDDVEHSLTYVNADESIFTVNKQKAAIYTKDSIMLQAEKTIQFKTKQFFLTAEQTIIESTVGTRITSPTTQHIGNFDVTGGITATLNIEAQGTVKGLKGVGSSTIDLDKHVHGNGNDGNDTNIPHM